MRNVADDPVLGSGLVLDFQANHVMPDLLAGGGTTYMFDRGPNRIQCTCVSFVAGTWVIETPGIYPIQTIDLDGTADYVTFGTGAWFELATNAAPGVSYEIVALPDAVGTSMLMAGFVTGTGGEAGFPQLLIEGTGYVEFRPTQDTGETSAVTGSVNITAGTVHHIVATFDETSKIAKIYVDNGETDSATETLICTNDTLVDLGADLFYIGARDNNGGAVENFFDGHVYWARMWNRELPRREVGLLYERARTVLGL